MSQDRTTALQPGQQSETSFQTTTMTATTTNISKLVNLEYGGNCNEIVLLGGYKFWLWVAEIFHFTLSKFVFNEKASK